MLLLVLVSATLCSGEPIGGTIGGSIGGPIGGQRLGATEPKDHQGFLDSKPWIPSPSQPKHLSRQVDIWCVIELLWHGQSHQFQYVNYAFKWTKSITFPFRNSRSIVTREVCKEIWMSNFKPLKKTPLAQLSLALFDICWIQELHTAGEDGIAPKDLWDWLSESSQDLLFPLRVLGADQNCFFLPHNFSRTARHPEAVVGRELGGSSLLDPNLRSNLLAEEEVVDPH